MPREGHDYLEHIQQPPDANFNPRAPRGARPRNAVRVWVVGTFQSTCPARGTTPTAVKLKVHRINFNPRAPRGARLFSLILANKNAKFQSTCPARGTTTSVSVVCLLYSYFNPRAPRGARRKQPGLHRSPRWISIHVPREGHDPCTSCPTWRSCCNFNPRAPRGARRGTVATATQVISISIHVPREGHDAA